MSAPVAWSVQTGWPPDPRHIRDARRFVVDRLVADGLGDVAEAAALIVSELATNAVKHAGSGFRVTVVREGRHLVVEVHDDNSAAVSPREVQPLELSGRGLQLVSALSNDWGVTPHVRGGKSVWAALDVAEPAGGQGLRP